MNLKTGIIISVIAHIALVGLLVANFQFSKVEINATGSQQPKINAKAVDSKRVEQLVEKLKKEKLTKSRQEQKRLEDLKKAEEAAKQRRRDEEKKAEDARKKRVAAENKRKAEEKKAEELKQKRIADEKARKKKEDAEKKRKAEAERKRKAEEEKKRKEKEEAERKRKAEEERKRKEAEEKARQEALEKEMQAAMDAEAAELAAAKQAQINSEVAKFSALIEGKIQRNWYKPEQEGFCQFKIRLGAGGIVIDVTVVEGDAQHCESGKRAVYRAEPLPVSKDPAVFEVIRNINMKLSNKSEDTQ